AWRLAQPGLVELRVRRDHVRHAQPAAGAGSDGGRQPAGAALPERAVGRQPPTARAARERAVRGSPAARRRPQRRARGVLRRRRLPGAGRKAGRAEAGPGPERGVSRQPTAAHGPGAQGEAHGRAARRQQALLRARRHLLHGHSALVGAAAHPNRVQGALSGPVSAFYDPYESSKAVQPNAQANGAMPTPSPKPASAPGGPATENPTPVVDATIPPA